MNDSSKPIWWLIRNLNQQRQKSLKKPPKKKEKASAGQVVYEPHSKAGAIGTLTPVNMAEAVNKFMAALTQKHGLVDQVVAEKLGYTIDEVIRKNGVETPSKINYGDKKIHGVLKNGTSPGISSSKFPRVGIQKTLERSAPKGGIKGPGDIAGMFADISDSAQEEVYLVTTDKSGRILEVHKFAKGTSDEAPAKSINCPGIF